MLSSCLRRHQAHYVLVYALKHIVVFVSPAGRLDGQIHENYSTKFFTPAMLTGTIDFYHIIPLWPWPWLRSQGLHKAKPVCFSFFTLFFWSGWNLMWWWSNSSWTSWDCPEVKFIETRKITAVFLIVSPQIYRWHAFGCLRINLIQSWSDGRYCCILYVGTRLIDLDLVSKS